MRDCMSIGVDREGDQDIEAGEEVVVPVQGAVRGDIQFGAVQHRDPVAAGRPGATINIEHQNLLADPSRVTALREEALGPDVAGLRIFGPQPIRMLNRGFARYGWTTSRSSGPATTWVPNRRLMCSIVARSHSASVRATRSSRIRRTRSGTICSAARSARPGSIEIR